MTYHNNAVVPDCGPAPVITEGHTEATVGTFHLVFEGLLLGPSAFVQSIKEGV